MRITHVVCTSNLAGVERHIAVLAAAQHDRGHEVTVLGGDTELMCAAIDRPGVRLIPAPDVATAARRLAGPAGRRADIVATNMTAADLAALTSPALVGTPIVSTRHFAARRGSRQHVRAITDRIEHRLAAEIAVSEFVAGSIDVDATVILPGVPDRLEPPCSRRERIVLAVQRLEPEKSTDVALRAFAASGLTRHGWRLLIAGDGSHRVRLAQLAVDLGIDSSTDLLGHRSDIETLMARSGIFLATADAEPMGLSVLEAMSSRLPVVATGAGGHLESVGPVAEAALFPPGDSACAAHLLTDLAQDAHRRERYGQSLLTRQRSHFSVSAHVDATEELYDSLVAGKRPLPAPREMPGRDLVVISLEPWDRVWRRNQHLVAGLLRRDPQLRVLFVEPAQDPLHAVRGGAAPRPGRGLRRGPHLPGAGPDGLWLLEPTKVLPRRVDPHQDERWARAVRGAAGQLGFVRPALWVNDPTGAHVLSLTGWPTLYDITDDWLVADRDGRTRRRLVRDEGTLMRSAAEVVVCSPGLLATKSAQRPLTLLRNAVDVDRYRRPTPRPEDLPEGTVVVYVGTLHSDRLDVPLVARTARELAGSATMVLIGPNALAPDEDAALSEAGVERLGGRDFRTVPAYLQHADVLLVPHLVTDFTESLDPIKLYEYQAAGRPVVSTPVAGFREVAGAQVRIAAREDFAQAIRQALSAPQPPASATGDVPTWTDRVREMQSVIERVSPPEREDTAPSPDGSNVPTTVRVRLGHAAVQRVAAEHGLDLLHIKGDALDESLVHPGRRATDADVLVRPEHVQQVLAACTAAGYRPVGRFATSSPFEHSTTLWHELWGHLDVHRLYPGIGLAPEEAFEALWSARGHMPIAGVDCPVPAVTDQICVLVLHAGRSVSGGQATADVTHAWHGADATTQSAVRARVEQLHAQVAFAAGLGELDTLPPSHERDLWAAVTRPGRVQEWRARIAAAPDLRSKARLLARAPLVNTDHLATRLGRRPTPLEVAAAFVDRLRRGARELTRGGGRG